MVLGVGVDLARISDFDRCWPVGPDGAAPAEADLDAFVRRTFTEAERAEARGRGRGGARYLAGRFAVKGAVFKAVAPLTREGFDLRCVECLADDAGAPRVVREGPLAAVLAEAGVDEVLVSITNEGDLALAMAVAQGPGR